MRRPPDFVEGFSYRDLMEGIPVHDEQGSRDRPYDLTVIFEPDEVDAALAALGSAPWTGPRPELLVVVAVRNGDTPVRARRRRRQGTATCARRWPRQRSSSACR